MRWGPTFSPEAFSTNNPCLSGSRPSILNIDLDLSRLREKLLNESTYQIIEQRASQPTPKPDHGLDGDHERQRRRACKCPLLVQAGRAPLRSSCQPPPLTGRRCVSLPGPDITEARPQLIRRAERTPADSQQ